MLKYLVSYDIIYKNNKISTDDDLSLIIEKYDIASIVEMVLKYIFVCYDDDDIDILFINFDKACVQLESIQEFKKDLFDVDIFYIGKLSDSYIHIRSIEKYEDVFDYPKEPEYN
jgi:hypothetical protein